MFLLDSNLLSELRSAKRCHPAVRAWQQVNPLATCWISVITLLEIRRGIDQVERKDAPFAAVLNEWMEGKVKPAFAGRVLAVTPAAANTAPPGCRHFLAHPRVGGFASLLFALAAFLGCQTHGVVIGHEHNFPIRVAKIALATFVLSSYTS